MCDGAHVSPRTSHLARVSSAGASVRRGTEVFVDKVVGSAAEAVADIASGSTIAVGGFGVCGIPSGLIDALLEQGADELEAGSNKCGVDEGGLGGVVFAPPDPADDLVVRGGEQGVRPAVPAR